jgi:hypothetical protein
MPPKDEPSAAHAVTGIGRGYLAASFLSCFGFFFFLSFFWL